MDYTKSLIEIKKDFTAETLTGQWVELTYLYNETRKGSTDSLPFLLQLLKTFTENLEIEINQKGFTGTVV